MQPGFSLNAYVAPAVAEICQRLDGLPLAIELAAARVESLTPQEITRRLDDRFALLTQAGASDAARHQTLGAALDWSHELLTEPERALLRRLSVFVGGCDLEAAEAVCAEKAGGEAIGARRDQLGERLAVLVRKSLEVVDSACSPTPRYRLLETVRVYAGERLEEARETAVLREAHARFYLALSERAEPELTGPDQQAWLERLEAEHANLRSAIEWSLSHGHAEWALRLAGALVLFWRVRCHFSEGRELLEAAVSAGDGAAEALQAKALWGAGFMAEMAGDSDGAERPLEESLARFRELGDQRGCARALLILGNRLQYHHRGRALSLLEESAGLAREVGDDWCLGHAVALVGFDHLSRGDLPVARTLFGECVEVARRAEDRQGLRFGLVGLGAAALGQGDFVPAESLLKEAVAVSGGLGELYSKAWALCWLSELAIGRGGYDQARELGDEAVTLASSVGSRDAEVNSLLPMGRAARAQGDRHGARRLFDHGTEMASIDGRGPLLQELGELTAEEGQPGTARALFEEALRLARARGDKRHTASALHGLGQLASADGEARAATVLHDEALALWREIGAAPQIVVSLEAIAGLAGHDGRYERAARLLGAAQALRDGNGYVRLPWESSSHEADITSVREGLCAQAFEAALASGMRLSLAEAAVEASRGGGNGERPASGWSSLTDSERQVAILVGEGLTNPQIAQRLFISPRTVKRRLTRLFGKLGVDGRAQLRREVRRREHEHVSSAGS